MKIRNHYLALSLIISFSVYSQQKISLDNIYQENKFTQETVSGVRSMKDGIHYTVLKDGEIVKYDYKEGQQQEILYSLLDNPIKGESKITSYLLTSNENKILLTTSRDYIYRYSYVSSHYIYDISSKEITPLYGTKQQMAKMSPDGENVAFVVGNNLYVRSLLSGEITQVTRDGKKGEIINGMPDWVYEEEFTLKNAFEWSDDGRKIAFIRFNESHVKEFQMAEYNELYPTWEKFKYPKAGEENSIVSVHVFDLISGKLVTMDIGEEKDIYIPRIKWTRSSEQLTVIRLNRLQNRAAVLLCNTKTGKSDNILTERNEKFVSEVTNDFISFLDDGEHFIVMSEESEFMHLYLYNITGVKINAITSGKWEVDRLLGVDQARKQVYYTSTEVSPMERHVYKINFDGTDKIKLTSVKGMNRADFSESFDYFINYHSSSGSPLKVTLHNKKGKTIRVLEQNEQLIKATKDHGFVKKEFFDFKGPSGDKLLGYMYKPQDFSGNKKYPLLIYVYGGPESQDVLDRWDRGQAWFQLLVQKGYVVACIDNRGTNGRGEKFKKLTYLQLGKLEVEDQIAAAEHLVNQSYIDRSRIGMFGWSYGGYMTLNCLMIGNQIFKMGIAVAPVTSWRYYDTIYTERFMRKPQDNSKGYDENSPLTHVEKLKGKLLLVHGSGDDNVHFQNSMMIAKELVQHNKQFDMMFYPNKNHGIYGGNTRHHLYTLMTNYILENL